jgi:hypothetical protein
MIRRHLPDEEPDVDERPDDEWAALEELHAAGHCDRCGHAGHQGERCPIVTLQLLRSA